MSIRLLLLFSIEYPKVIAICQNLNTVKLGDEEQIGVKEPFPVTNLPLYFTRIRNTWH